MYKIQMKHARGWMDVAEYADQSEANRKAKLLSVENPNQYRVVEIIQTDEGITEQPLIAYNWGQAYIDMDGAEVRVPSYYETLTEAENEDDTPLVFYGIQSRLNPVLNDMRYTNWTRFNTRQYVELDEAFEDAEALSRQHPERDFRVIYTDFVILPCIVFRGGAKYAQLGDAPIDDSEKGN